MKNDFCNLGNRELFIRLTKFFAALFVLTLSTVPASTYYVATTGNDGASGSIDQPFATLQKGHDKAVAGDTVYIRGGTYLKKGSGPNANCGIYITKSGSSATKRICFWAYKNEIPKFDFSGLTLATSASAGIRINGSSWLHLKGLEICNVPQPGGAANNGLWANPASNCIFEQINSHNNAGPGICLAAGTGGNVVLNCDSHDNYDPKSSQGDGQNADGFGRHYQNSGPSDIFRGCRAWSNSDDGFDCINQGVAVTIENCWFWLNGYKPGTMTSAPSGNGNGCKVGGWGLPPKGYPSPIPVHTVRNCVAFLNKSTGFDQNFQPGNNFYYNNTAFNNDTNFMMAGYDFTTKSSNVGMGTYKNNVAFSGTLATGKSAGATMTNNSWDIAGLALAASDFVSIDTAGIYGPRKADGSLPDVQCMHLAQGSKCIDKGVDVGLAFAGAAPDLGAYESAGVGISSQLHFPKTPSAWLSNGESNFQKSRQFNAAGRSLDNGIVGRALQPVIMNSLHSNGQMQEHTILPIR